jgi:hypothetical protein
VLVENQTLQMILIKEERMKQAKWLMFTLVIVVALGLVPMMAQAQDDGGAIVIKDTSCRVRGPMYSYFLIDAVKVITPSRNSNVNVSCHGDLPETIAVPDKAIVLDYDSTGHPCCAFINGDSYETQTWHETITPNGSVSVTCHFKGDERPSLFCRNQN